MTPLEKVKDYFQTLSFPLEIILFDQSTSTSQLAAEALGVEVGQIAKTLVFISKKKEGEEQKSAVVVTSGDVRVNTKKLKALVGYKPKFASGDEALELTGFPPGGVCPFGLPEDIPVYIDKTLERFDVVYAAAGTANSAVPITVPQLVEATQGELCCACDL